MPLYRQGTVSLTEGSRALLGEGTEFGSQSSPGDILILSAGNWVSHCYEIKSIESDTEATLDTPALDTVTDSEFVILRSVSTANNLYLMRKIDEFLKDRQISLEEFRDWIHGTPDGGPEGDGRYPLTDRYGETTLVPSPNATGLELVDTLQQAQDILDEIGDLDEALNSAFTSAQAAADSEAAASASESAAAASAAAASISETNASDSASAAAASESAAQTAKTLAEAAAVAAATSETNAAQSETEAQQYRDEAHTHAQTALEAVQVTLGDVFDDDNISSVRGWTSSKIDEEFETRVGQLAEVATTGDYTDLVNTPGDATPSLTGLMTSTDKTKLDSIEAGAQVNTVNSVAGKTGVVVLTKGDVGLGNVDNTSDVDKPISSATQQALNTKVTSIAGKGLSTEDYTTAEKNKLAAVGSMANRNVTISTADPSGGSDGDVWFKVD